MLMFRWDKEDMKKHLWTLSCEPATVLTMCICLQMKVNANFFAWKRVKDTQVPSKL